MWNNKLRGSTKNKVTKDKNGENVPHLAVTKEVLVRWNKFNNEYQHDSMVLYKFDPSNLF